MKIRELVEELIIWRKHIEDPRDKQLLADACNALDRYEAMLYANEKHNKETPKYPDMEYTWQFYPGVFETVGFCPECGLELTNGYEKCPKCGQKLKWEANEKKKH